MKKLTVTTILASTFVALFSINVFAEELPITFKCLVESDLGQDIAYFSWLPSERIQQQASLLLSDVDTMDGKRVRVRHIVECVIVDKKFKDKIAEAEDEKITE